MYIFLCVFLFSIFQFIIIIFYVERIFLVDKLLQ